MSATFPIIHSNGTSREELQRGYDDAAAKLRDFVNAWNAIEFNARDYYLKEGLWEKAVGERVDLTLKIVAIEKHLEEIREYLHS